MTTPLPNLRDVGGVRGRDGFVRTGLLWRSALPAATDTVPPELEWPPPLVVDLRSPGEMKDEQHPLAGGASRILNLPLLEQLRPDWYAHATLVSMYGLVLDDASAMLVELVEQITESAGPVLIHCAAGKDRTGIATALLLRLLGVDSDDVVSDFLRTEAALEEIDARLRPDRAAPSGVSSAFYAVPREAIDLVLTRWDEHPGGVEAWFRDAGGRDETLDALRAALLV